ESADPIEIEGVARARQAQRIAALTLCVIDRSTPLMDEDRALVRNAGGPQIVLASKSDLPAAWAEGTWPAAEGLPLPVSAVTGEGLAVLRERIASALTSVEALRDPPALSNVRHLSLVREALDAVTRAATALARGATEEIVLVDLAEARQALEQITGRRAPEDLLRHIFAKFCVGK